MIDWNLIRNATIVGFTIVMLLTIAIV